MSNQFVNQLENTKIRILYIDDEPNNLTAFKASFRRDFDIITATSANEGLKIVENEDLHIIISDQRMPDITGVEFFEMVRKDFPDPIRILLTGYADIEAVIAAINRGEVYRYITKPWDENDLKITIHNAFEIFSLRAENKQLIGSLAQANQQLEFMLRQKLLS